jgi:CheY-like chemotaxis protein
MRATVLLIDDDFAHLEMLASLLEEEGLTVRKAGSGAEALTLLADDVPDLCIVDVMMPFVDGLAMLRRMRASPRTAAVPVIMVTAVLLEKLPPIPGCVGMFAKPLRIDDLLACLREVLADRASPER